MRLIDADALLEKAWDANTRIGYVQVVDVGDVIDAPTISPDEACGLVHCAECDLWNKWDSAGHESLGNLTCSCAHWTVEDGAVIRTKPTDFCSYGERMVGDDA